MAVPKKKISKQRKRKRRSHHHLTAVHVARCARCGAATRPHAVCDACGYYKGSAVLVEREQGAWALVRRGREEGWLLRTEIARL